MVWFNMHTFQYRNEYSIRVAIVQRFLTPFRIPFFQKLCTEYPKYAITIIYSNDFRDKGKLVLRTCSHPFPAVSVRGYSKKVGPYTFRWLNCLTDLKRGKYDVIVLEGTFGILSHYFVMLWAKLNRKAVIFWVSGWDNPNIANFSHILKGIFIRVFTRFANHFICYSSFAKEYLVGLGIASSKCTVAQNTIDVEEIIRNRARRLAQASALRSYMGLEEKPVLLFVGGLIAEKKLMELIQIHNALRAEGLEVHTLVIGDGPLKNRIEQSAKCCEGIHFLGRIVDEVDVYFLVGDVFVLPGSGGLAINQAMANGLPVVCTHGDGTERDLIVDGVTGYIMQSGATKDWVDVIKRILNSKEIREQMSKSCIERVRSMASLNRMCEAFIGAISSTHRKQEKRYEESF